MGDWVITYAVVNFVEDLRGITRLNLMNRNSVSLLCQPKVAELFRL